MATAKKKEEAIDFSEDAGAGFENVTQEDLGTPFLSVLQKLSPELDEDKAKFMPDAKAGMIINSLTQTIYGGQGEPMEFVPCGYQKCYVEWKDRDNGGGFVQTHGTPGILSGTERNNKGQDVLTNGNIVVTTAYVFGFAKTGDGWDRCVISFTSTQLKKSRQWLALMRGIKMDGPDGKFTPPMFSHVYHISTLSESNDKGSWYGWKIENGGLNEDRELIGESRTAAAEIASGRGGMTALPASTDSSEADDDNAPF